MALAERCEAAGISVATYYQRLKKGMTQDEALSYQRPQTLAERCAAVGISVATYYLRIQKGMTQDEALSTPPLWGMGGRKKLKLSPQQVEDSDLNSAPSFKMNGGRRTEYVFEADFQKNKAVMMRKKREKRQKSPACNQNDNDGLPQDDGVGLEEKRPERSECCGEQNENASRRCLADIRPASTSQRGNASVGLGSFVDEMRARYGSQAVGYKQKVVKTDDWACGGWRAVILKEPKKKEYKYQLISLNNSGHTYTNDVRQFIEAVARACDPQGKLKIQIIER